MRSYNYGKKYVKISTEDLRHLFLSEMKLQALECGGVDNWTWYGESISEYLSDTPYDDFDEYIENTYTNENIFKRYPEVK